MIRNAFRRIRLEYLKLLRTKGAPSIVAKGFALGVFLEFITLPTLGIAFFLLYPLNLLFRGSLPAALIGYLMGKVILPVFLYINYTLGNRLIGGSNKAVGSPHWHDLTTWHTWKEKGLAFFVGSAIVGAVVAVVGYVLVYWALISYRRRKERRNRI
ncbi:DUF2062 domain-containing protein [Polycladomyces subterraneus]|uniref:DUF2062 domain-containing protein n=1 Tax=Polycladomyces subterraneus TaxID=1016997 RepID=A0ABT8IHQ7_9BACL|nr:DUF2062 domain-containing protein [Polycladomyces subterraneus]MDN4592326.1 DUF2062 domain-containing protein [Polycladomyces subterraneus]